MVLLHGMVAGNSFGAAYDALAEHATLVVPDLLASASGVKHTWRNYTGFLNGLIRDTGWCSALTSLPGPASP